MTIEKLATGSALILHLNIGVFSDADKLVGVREFATCFRLKKQQSL